ncbi:hypothetical protein [Spirochaeta dissipatitropha]
MYIHNKYLRNATVILLMLLSTGAVWPFTLQFQGNPGQPINETYSLTGIVEVSRTARIRHRGAAVEYFFTLNAGQNAGGSHHNRNAVHEDSGSPLYYEALDANGELITDSNGIAGFFDQSNRWQTIDVIYTIRFNPGQFPEAGRFEDTIQLQLYSGDSANAPLIDSHDLRIRITMDEVIDMEILESGAPYSSGSSNYELNYDELLPGFQRSADLGVLANTSFNVTLQSQYGGVLIDQVSGDSVPYQFSFDGTVLQLTAGGNISAAAGEPPTGANGRRFPMDIEILPYNELPAAGTYQDLISITIEGN